MIHIMPDLHDDEDPLVQAVRRPVKSGCRRSHWRTSGAPLAHGTQRISRTSASTSAFPHSRSVVTAGTPSRSARTRQARSASDRPWGLVMGRSLAISMQSAAVNASIQITTSPPVTRRRLATSRGSPPSAATFDKTSAQFTTLIVAPSAIASTTVEEPSSSCSSAITAEASSTDVSARGASASGTAAAGFVLAVFRSGFSSPPSDQLVAERPARVVAEHPPRTLSSGPTPLYLRLGELGGLRHIAIVPPLGTESAEGQNRGGNVVPPVRNPFRKDRSRGKPAAAVVVDVDAARERYLERCPDRPTTELEDSILFNAVVLEMGEEAEQQPEAEGKFVIYLVDEDGFVLKQDGKYLLPPEVREGNTFTRILSETPS